MTGDGDGGGPTTRTDVIDFDHARRLAALRESAHQMATALLEVMAAGDPPLVGMSGTRYWALRGQSQAAGHRETRVLVAQRGHVLVLLNAPADRSILDATLATITLANADLQLSTARTFLEDAEDVMARASQRVAAAHLRGRSQAPSPHHAEDDVRS